MSPDDPRHGTRAGYLAHMAAKQHACDDCKRAAAEYMRAFRSRPGKAERTRRESRAATRALWKLAAAHREEYEALRTAELLALRDRKTEVAL